MMWSIVQVRSTPKTILNFHDPLDRVSPVTKTRYNNYVTDYKGTIYTENETKLLWSIEPSAVCDKNQIRKWHD